MLTFGAQVVDAEVDETTGAEFEQRLRKIEEFERMIVAIRRLPPRAQTAFLLHRFRQMTYPAIARHMGISRSAVKQLVLRAATQVIEELEGAP